MSNTSSKWNKAHPEEMKAINLKSYFKRRTYILAQQKQYRLDNKARISEQRKQYYANNKDHVKALSIEYEQSVNRKTSKKISNEKWRALHKEQRKAYMTKWMRSDNGKIWMATHQAVHNKEMGYECLNIPFKCSEGHHINKDQVVFIPKELHRKYPHNHNKPETMIEVNRIAMTYLFNCKA